MKRSGYRITEREEVIVNRDAANGFVPNARGVAKAIDSAKALIPTKTSDLTNDSGYLTLADLPLYNGGVQ